MKTAHLILRRALFLTALVLCVARTGFPQATQLQEFEIPDQFDVVHTDQEFEETVTVFLGADRKGTAYTQEWWEALGPAISDLTSEGRVQLVQFAHLRGVPFFVRGKVRNAFPTDDPSGWILLDWKGHFSKTYGFEEDSLNVLVFDDRGRLVLRRAVREIEEADLEDIVVTIRGAAAPEIRDSS